MKKRIALALALLIVLSAAACSAGGENGAAAGANNTAPVITGVIDKYIDAGEVFDAFEGVAATDKEEGDITNMIYVRAEPELKFRNGKLTPKKGGTYELIYTVTDKGGLSYEVESTLTISAAIGEPEVYKQFDFSTQTVTETFGWEARIGEAASAKAELREGSYVFDIANAGGGDGDIQLAFSGLDLIEAQYRVKVWAKSTADTYAHLIARNERAEGWEALGAVWNQRIGAHVAPIVLDFTSGGRGSAELLLNLGKITPNPDNPADTTPENFTVMIDKIELYEITGDESEAPVFNADFTSGRGLNLVTSDGAKAEAVYENGEAIANITSYPNGGGIWSVKANLSLGGNKIESGNKYYYRFVMNSENAQNGEALVESDSREWQARAHFNGFAAPAGEDFEISGVFTAETDISDPVIRLQIGNAAEGVTSNRITFKSVEFGLVEGDRRVDKTTYTWMAFGGDSDNSLNPEHPWVTFNATDDDNDRGVGTVYTDGGSFFYRIDDAGTVDWHNKLVAGYRENPLKLEGGSYYTVEITAKADKRVSCNFILNPIGTWDPRINEVMDIATEARTFTFSTDRPVSSDMDFEMLFQFGSEATAALGDVTIELTNVTIYQQKVL